MLRSTLTTAAAVVVLAAPAFAQQGRDETTFTWSRDVPSGAQLTIRNIDGPITVHESSGNRIEVRATKVPRSRGDVRDVAFDVRETNGNVEVCTVYENESHCGDERSRNNNRNIRVRVDYTISVPRATRVRAATGNGNVSIERAGADLSASTGNGRIDIGETTGRVDASSGNGPIVIENASGPVKVSTGNGRITVNTTEGPVNASTGSGDIDVRTKSLSSDSDMSFSSGAGSIRVSLPADYNGRIDATSGSGSLHSDFEISVVGRLDSHHVRGTIGKGGSLMRLTTGSGQIELRKF